LCCSVTCSAWGSCGDDCRFIPGRYASNMYDLTGSLREPVGARECLWRQEGRRAEHLDAEQSAFGIEVLHDRSLGALDEHVLDRFTRTDRARD